MKRYTVIWIDDIYAESPQEAAQQQLARIRNESVGATFCHVAPTKVALTISAQIDEAMQIVDGAPGEVKK